MRLRVSLSVPVLLLLFLPLPRPAASAPVQLVAGAFTSGGMGIGGGSYSMESSIGQAFTGKVTGGSYQKGVGFWYVIFEDRIVGVEDVPSLPLSYRLDQNFPNPFNPQTTIRFALSQPVRVTMRLFDPRGREVTVLIDERMDAGEHRLVFRPQGLASGVYLYRLEAGDFVQSRRLTLVK